MKKLKERWGVSSNWQLAVIFIVFSVTGSAAAKIAGPITEVIGITKDWGGWVYWPIRILLIFPLYQVLLVFFGWLFGQFTFFWNFEKKMLRYLGLGFLLKD
ncbi:MAG: diacylglyceryl transferase [Bacteroidetes bacterium]|nr:diacylglyceryl transferase [Bacteroidota bacterium]